MDEFSVFEKPGIRVGVDWYLYTDPKGDQEIYIAIPEDGVKVFGYWGDGVDKDALQKDLSAAIQQVLGKHCK